MLVARCLRAHGTGTGPAAFHGLRGPAAPSRWSAHRAPLARTLLACALLACTLLACTLLARTLLARTLLARALLARALLACGAQR